MQKKGDSCFETFCVARMQEATEMLKEVDAKLEPSDSWDLTSIFFVVPVVPILFELKWWFEMVVSSIQVAWNK